MPGRSHQLDPAWIAEILELQDALAVVLDAEGRIAYFNRACEVVSGRSAADVLGRPIWDVVIAEPLREASRERYRAALVSGLSASQYENEWIDAEGRSHAIVWRGGILPRAETDETWVVATGIEITELRESEARYRWLSSATIEGITHHERGVIIDVNQRCCEMWGWTEEEMIGRSVLDFATEASQPIILDRIKRGLTGAYEVVGQRKDGSTFPLEIVTRMTVKDGQQVRVAGLRDISERKQLEADRAAAQDQLARAQRLESVGVLAGGVAHDFNNLLSVILGYAQLAIADERVHEDVRADLREVVNATRMAAKLTGQLLVFAKREPVPAEPLSLNATLREMLPLLERTLKEDVVLEVDLGDDLWPARVGRVHLEQVIVNLALNARDAMPRGGLVRLTTRNVAFQQAHVVTSGVLPAGAYVVVQIADDGVGMTPEVLGRIFEPFFSTKRDRARTGLGMAVCYGAVDSVGGGIDVASAPGAGTTIEVILPRGAAVASSQPSAELEVSAELATVLLVEDKQVLLRLAERTLRGAGHRVVAASSGPDALALLECLEEPPDVLVTDVIMPGMSGPELASEVAARVPGIRILFMSGYSDDVLSIHELEGRQFLAKPFAPDELTRRVAELLAQPPT